MFPDPKYAVKCKYKRTKTTHELTCVVANDNIEELFK